MNCQPQAMNCQAQVMDPVVDYQLGMICHLQVRKFKLRRILSWKPKEGENGRCPIYQKEDVQVKWVSNVATHISFLLHIVSEEEDRRISFFVL
jgi:hypothetical protein